MPDLSPSYRVEPDAEFADRLERVLVQRLTAPASSRPTEVPRVTTVSRIDTTPGNSWTGEDDALIDLDSMGAARRPARRRLAATIALGAAAAAVLAVALTAVIRIEDEHDLADVPPPTLAATTVTTGPQSTPFEGTWVSTDADGSSPTMEIARSGIDFEVVVRDDPASVCSGAPSTMTGTGRLDANGALVIPQPVLTCDDGRTPEALDGSSLEELLRDLTFLHDPQNYTLTDNLGSVWARVGGEGASPAPPASGGMWPQSSADEVSEAQELADAGDPAHTWQVDPQLASEEGWGHLNDPGAEIVERFLREELGWEEFVFDVFQEYVRDVGDGADGVHRGVTFLRCAPGAANPLYSAGADQLPGARCAPTIDELRYETVSVDLSQPDRLGPDGIWVVSGWRITEPFMQADPSVLEAEATAHLENFLQARIDGEGAEGYILSEVPLLYATTAGARYERFEVDRVSEPRWPYGGMDFTVRLFADGGETVVEQPISLEHDGFVESDGLPPRATLSYWNNYPRETTENGQPVPVPYEFLDGDEFLDGAVTVSAAAPWLRSLHFEAALALDDQALERVALAVDSLQVSCRPIPAAADAAALAANLQADPDLVATAAVEVTIGGIAGLQMDLTLAAGASACPEDRLGSEPDPEDRIRGTGFPLELGSRMRLHLLDLPEGSGTPILAIAVVAPDARFEAVVDAATPIIESIELLGPVDIAVGDVLPEDFRDFLASEFGLAVEDASELADSFETLDSVEDEITLQRSGWSEAAEIRVYLGRRTDDGGLASTAQWPVGAAVWVVDVNNAGVPSGAGLDLAGRVVLVHDAETGESLTYFQSAPQGR